MIADASYWVTWFPGALLATGGVLTLLFKGVMAFAETRKALPKLVAALPVIEEMAAQFQPNSGHSMRDQIDGLTREQKHIRRDMANRDARFNRRLTRVEEITGIEKG